MKKKWITPFIKELKISESKNDWDTANIHGPEKARTIPS